MIALLATAAVAAAPWYAVAATQQVGVAAVEGTPVDERLISLTWKIDHAGSGEAGDAAPAADARQQFAPTGFTSVVGGFAVADLWHGKSDDSVVEINVAYRENMCDHLVVTGSCPSAAGEVLLPAAAADELGFEVGNILHVEHVVNDRAGEPRAVVSEMQLVGVYQIADRSEPYWADGSLIEIGADGDAESETAFTAPGTLLNLGWVTYTYDLIAAPDAFATADAGQLRATLGARIEELQRLRYEVRIGGLDGLLSRIERDRENVVVAVTVGVALLLLITWFALVVVLRESVSHTRGDVGWWRLRGAPSGRGWILVAGQSVVPLVAGAAVGATAGLGLGRRLGQAIEGGAERTALLAAVGLVGLTLVGGLVSVLAAQFGILRTPVRDLLRGVPARLPRWRRSLVDLVLVALAAAAVGQALVAGPGVAGLALLAPGLAALALALLGAWAVQPFAAWLASRSLRAGRLAVALAAASMARRPGTHRLFALVSLVVALATTGAIGWDTDDRTHAQRSAFQTGADRVIDVAAADAAQLLAAVRTVDPSGIQAMAVIGQPSISDRPPMLAVDSTRLGVVAGWRDDYGGSVDDVAATLRPSTPAAAVIEASQIDLEATATDPAGTPVHLQIQLRMVDTGELVEAVVGPLTSEPGTYHVAVPGCAASCRLVAIQLLGAESTDDAAVGGYDAPASGTQVDLFGLTAAESSGLSELLTDPTRWRPALGPRDLGPTITATDGGLHMAVQGSSPDRNDWAFVADTPAPLPTMVAGWQPASTDEVRMAPLAGVQVPAEIAGTAALVPRLGQTGVLVDLEYAERLAPDTLTRGAPQVWLSPTAAPSVVSDLQEAGLTPLGQESLSDNRERLNAEGSSVGVRFQTVMALVGLLLAVGAVLVHAAQQRPAQAAELAALRAQGVDPAVVRRAGYGGFAAVIGAAALVGLAAGIAGARIASILHPGFVDGWTVLPAAGLRVYPVVIVGAVVIVALGGAALASGAALVRRTTPWEQSA